MLETATYVAERVDGLTRAEFDANVDLRDALAYRIQNIGEAASRLSTAFRETHPNVPWKKIVGMRHRIVHDYLSVDFDLVWEVATTNVRQLAAILRELDKGGE
ncbi:MAG: hypothetical protein AMXMBFR84_07150 [Candidatus Hydrogenedentota bacterium]